MKFPNNFGNLAFLDVSPVDYYDQLMSLNRLVQQSLAKKLQARFEKIPDVAAILIPGSDGRLEAGSPLSHFELITILNSDNPKLEELLGELRQATQDVGLHAEALEVKTLKSQMHHVDDNPKIIQPGRVADSTLGYGEDSDLQSAKRRLARDIIATNNSGSVAAISSLIRDAKKVNETGVNRIFGNDCAHFDIGNGIVFFNPEAKQFSFKIGPLRLVQNVLLREEVKYVRDGKREDYFNTRPNSILNRIDYMKDSKMLDMEKESLSEIKEIYAFFLRMYHRSEENYRLSGSVSMQLDEQDKVEVSKRLAKLTELMERFRIK